jgi:CMP-N-acetylneuraminic acid synthetase
MKKRITAMIPARIGSTRLSKKNLALLGDKPLIYYAIETARQSGIFDRIVVNSDSRIFEKIAKRYGVEFYQRPTSLGSSDTKSDSVIHDFMINHPADILVWVNPTSPLQTGTEIKEVVDYFTKGGYDSLITVKNEQVHCLLDNKPINFNLNEIFERTQDLKNVQLFVYSLMMWRYSTFLKTFEDRGYALLCGKVGFYSVSKMSSIIIKTEEDLKFAEYVLTGLKLKGDYKLQYDPLVEKDQ